MTGSEEEEEEKEEVEVDQLIDKYESVSSSEWYTC